MRTLVWVKVPPEAGTAAINDGRLPKVMESALERLKPEASYFFAYGGRRSALFVFDLKASSDLPMISEPFFSELNAEIEFIPVMNAEDLKAGLTKIGQSSAAARN